jgi:predicted transcriptional regulator
MSVCYTVSMTYDEIKGVVAARLPEGGQSALSAALGLTRSAVAQMLRGRIPPDRLHQVLAFVGLELTLRPLVRRGADSLMEVASAALQFAQTCWPAAHPARHAAFANSICALVCGFTGPYGGQSLREHAVSYASAGPGRDEQAVQLKGMGLTVMITPDQSLPERGQWDIDRAYTFAAPIVFGPLTNLHRWVAMSERCFNDDPTDLEALKETP